MRHCYIGCCGNTNPPRPCYPYKPIITIEWNLLEGQQTVGVAPTVTARHVVGIVSPTEVVAVGRYSASASSLVTLILVGERLENHCVSMLHLEKEFLGIAENCCTFFNKMRSFNHEKESLGIISQLSLKVLSTIKS